MTAQGTKRSQQTLQQIFEFRVRSAIQNLEGLTNFLKEIQVRAQKIDELHKQLARQWGPCNTVAARIREIKSVTERRDETGFDALEEMRGIEISVQRAEKALQDLTEGLEAANETTKSISGFQPDKEMLGQNNLGFESNIWSSRSELDKLEKEARGAGGPPWQKLRSVSGLWAEYLEYLAGLSLRHDGLDNRICEIADALIQELQRAAKGLGALAIPGREGAMGILPVAPDVRSGPETGASADAQRRRLIPRIVYLRFPEWTVWALPLAAYELWHIARSVQGSTIATLFYSQAAAAGGLPPDDPDHDHLADAFATATLGPAYPAAALLLALDPFVKRDRERAQIILYVLGKMSHQNNEFEAVLQELRRMWDEAVDQAMQSANAEAMRDELKTYVDELIEFLNSIPGVGFPTKRWATLRFEWVDALKEGSKDIKVSETPSIRFALTAAWKARVEKPAAVLEIAKRCEGLCREIMESTGGGTSTVRTDLSATSTSPTTMFPRIWPNLAK